MCLIVIAVSAAARYPLLVAANRDERHARATAVANWWPDQPAVFAGRDLKAGGTWLAVDRRGRLAAVTNIREEPSIGDRRSRGSLVADFVAGEESAERYAARTALEGSLFSAFNLLVLDGNGLHYTSNRAAPAKLGAGLHAFSNTPRELGWPKVASARAGAERVLALEDPLEALFELLAQRSDAGAPEDHYRTAHFVVGPTYGTRCSTVVLVDERARVTFAERTFDATGALIGEVRETFTLDARD